MARLKVGVLVSGRGSNLQSLIDACAKPGFAAEIVLVISNKADAYALERAKRAAIPTEIFSHKAFASREDFDRVLDAALRKAAVELVCLAGFMRILTPWFVERWRDRLINIHPSLLPAHKGLDTHARAIAAGDAVAGCTVHYVRAEMDTGPIILQARVPIMPGDDADKLASRVLVEEHRIYPEALGLIAQGRVAIAGDKAIIRDAR